MGGREWREKLNEGEGERELASEKGSDGESGRGS